MSFDPDSITPSKLNDLRAAAERAWGDDTRHPKFVGHPQPSAGHCYITSAWLQSRLGGHVATKDGHYFWASPDKRYVVDLTGDQFAHPPEDPHSEGMPLDEDDEPWSYDPHQKTWRPGPVMYKSADHPLYKNFRILSEDHGNSQEVNQRKQTFFKRADAAMRGDHVSSFKHSDLMGADPYPGDSPQKQEDWSMGAPMIHDEPDYNPDSDLSTHEYQFVFANGQMHVSPMHSHQDLAGHAGIQTEDNGPMAVGYAEVNQGHVIWSVSTNMGHKGLSDVLKEYSDTVGWKWDGMTNSNGEMSDEFGPKTSMYYKVRHDGHLILSKTPLPHGREILIEGKTARVRSEVGPARAAIAEWADDFGYKIAEWPGGGQFEDKMKNKEFLDLYNRGDTDFTPEKDDLDLELHGDLKCGTCGKTFPTSNALILHRRDHEQLEDEPIQDGKFPWPKDFDAPTGFGTIPVPNGGNTIAKVACMPVESWGRIQHYAGEQPWATIFAPMIGAPWMRFYGAYYAGQLVGYAAVADDRLVDVQGIRSEASLALLNYIQLHHAGLQADADSDRSAALLRRVGMVNVANEHFAAPKGQEPKDMIEEAIPFIYDIEKEHVHIGYAGQMTHDIGGRFTPGGIVEGYYEPGGKIVFVSDTNMPMSLYHFAQVWYHLYPQMEITSVEHEGTDGKSVKLAAEDVGGYVQRAATMDQAADTAHKALRYAGGQVYGVGGVVRDGLMGRASNDVDLLVTGLPPETVEHVLTQLPGEVKLTGKKFGVYRYKVNGQEVEVALPRLDKYESGRRGEGQVTVDHNLPVEDDLLRRDFTANSMAVNLDTGKLIDPYGGNGDIGKNILRTTHPDSFREDPTRLVRALTMHGRYGLQPDERTRHEMESNAHMLRGESPDALNEPFDKLLKSHNPAAAIRLGHDTGVLKHLLPEVDDSWDFDQHNPHHDHTLGDHHMHVLQGVAEQTHDPDERMAALLHDIGKPASSWPDPVTGNFHYYQGPNGEGAQHEELGAQMAEQRMRAGFNYPKARINRVTHLIQNHMFAPFNSPKGARRFIQRVGDDHADALLRLRQADMDGKGIHPAEQDMYRQVENQRQLVDEARKGQAPTDLSNLAISGNDLIQLGMQPGPQIGTVLRQLLDDVVATPTDNTRERLLQLAQGYIQAQPE